MHSWKGHLLATWPGWILDRVRFHIESTALAEYTCSTKMHSCKDRLLTTIQMFRLHNELMQGNILPSGARSTRAGYQYAVNGHEKHRPWYPPTLSASIGVQSRLDQMAGDVSRKPFIDWTSDLDYYSGIFHMLVRRNLLTDDGSLAKSPRQVSGCDRARLN